MIEIPVREDILALAKLHVEENPEKYRGSYDGDDYEKMIGRVGELVTAEFFGAHLNQTRGFDFGVDIALDYYTIDVKTKSRDYEMKPWWGFNIIVDQLENPSYRNNLFLFCSYSQRKNTLRIDGFLPKTYIKKRGFFLPKGSWRYRDDGQKFPMINGKPGYVHDSWEVIYAAMFKIEQREDFFFHAQNGTYIAFLAPDPNQ